MQANQINKALFFKLDYYRDIMHPNHIFVVIILTTLTTMLHKIIFGPFNSTPSYFFPFSPLLKNNIVKKCPQLYGLPSPNHTLQCRLYQHGWEKNDVSCWKKKYHCR
jgi:hypothetical protein